MIEAVVLVLFVVVGILITVIVLTKLAAVAAGALICALPQLLILWLILFMISRMIRSLFE